MSTTLDHFVNALYEQIATPKADIEKNIRSLLTEMVAKMELVSQQELDHQKIALQQANQRLNALQQQLEQLDARIKQVN